MKFVVGIDEVGRGPLAGPVAVGAVFFNKKDLQKIKKFFKDARDSKKLTPQKREEIAKRIVEAKKNNILRYIVRYESAKFIDNHGISPAIKSCIKKSLDFLMIKPKESKIFLDGGIKAPEKFIYQETIIKGDDKILAISLASIIAKVSRDNLMQKTHKKFPQYGFDVHKGYGTEKHRRAIKKHGLSTFHRKTFCKNLVS